MTSWRYNQSTGELLADGKRSALCYSGRGEGCNNPAYQAIRDKGPIPRGLYTCAAPINHDRLGPLSIRLTPVGHDSLGRDDFWIHGDNGRGDKSASRGCIIAPRLARSEFEQGDTVEVVEC